MPAKKAKYQRSNIVLNRLMELFPKTFFKRGKELPLKIGILKDLMATEEFSLEKPWLLKQTLYFYTNSFSYNKCLLQINANRVDLEGNIIEPVKEEHRIHAKECIKIINGKRKQKNEISKTNKLSEYNNKEPNKPQHDWPKITLKKKAKLLQT